MAELQKDKMIAETVNLLMKYLEVHSQTFEASVSIYKKITKKKYRIILYMISYYVLTILTIFLVINTVFLTI